MTHPPFIVAKRPLLSASGSSLTQNNLVFLIVFGTEKYLDGIRYLHTNISTQISGYGCDIA